MVSLRRIFRSRRLHVWGTLLLAYTLLMMFGGCADKLILFPSTGPTLSYGARRHTVPHRDGVVEVWVARSPAANGRQPEAYLLEFTGNATRAEDIASFVASRWKRHAVEAWVMNYPGYGGSTGPARLASIPPAALATYDALRQLAGNRPIVIAGNSLGTTAALHVAANRPCDGMILQSPVPLRSVILGQFGWWNLWLVAGPIAMQVPDELDATENAKRVTVPAVFITADADTLVLPSYQRQVIDAYRGEKRTITLAGKGHNDTVDGGDALKQFETALGWIVPRGNNGD